LPEVIVRGMRVKLQSLVEELASELSELNRVPKAQFCSLLQSLPSPMRDRLADVVMRDGHRGLLERRFISVEEFQQMLEDYAGDQTLARTDLINHIQQEFRDRGIEMSYGTVEERFRPDPVVRTMPYCIRQVFRELDGHYRTGLIPIEEMVGEEDPGEWLERSRRRLMFRSHSSMHRAISAQTGLSYAAVHKALTGSEKAGRIQVKIKRCLESWLEKTARGEKLDIPDKYRGVPVEQMRVLLPNLMEQFETKKALYLAIARQTEVGPGAVRQYFQENTRLNYAPMSAYRVGCELARTPRVRTNNSPN
ncbi:MAG: hypothetical protein KGZ25_14125, partial [Planctomycetes bacterium]|nr:hypothetical protein [Planctomycetota bacterium]